MIKTIITAFLLAGVLLLPTFNMFASIPVPVNGDSLSENREVAKAHSLYKKVVEENRIVGSLDEAMAVSLPQGIKAEMAGIEYILIIESMAFTPEGSKLTAYMSVEVPNSGKRIAFKGENLEFAAGGFTGGGRLELIEDVDIPLGESMKMVLKGGQGQSKTYVECDCDGYKEMGLKGEIQFSRDKLLPTDPEGNILSNQDAKVKAFFETTVTSWDDFMIEVGVTPFQVKDLEGFSFIVNSAIFDFSGQANAPSMVFPEGYESTDFIDGNKNMWKGFFLKDMVVKLPTALSKKNGERCIIEAHNLLIDNIGLSGEFLAKNLFTLNEGEMSNWAFSLDEISANITKNQLVDCGFNGEVNVPPLGDGTVLGYEAFIDPANQYTFIVSTTDTLSMEMWAAKLRLDPNSYVDISVIDGKFMPKAVLNGNLSVSMEKVELADVEFEELTLTPYAPYVKAKSFSFGSEYANQKMSDFPIAITDIGMVTKDERTGLKFNLKVNLTKSGSGGFTGETGLTLYAKAVEENNRQRWKFDGYDVNKIKIDISGCAFKIKGTANFFDDDPVYGDGFSGMLEAEFASFPKLTASAIFGNTGKFRYFYADALITLKTGIPIFAGLNLYSFGGGIYHHMTQLRYNETIHTDIGQNATGIVYQPDEVTAFGFKATVGVGLSKQEIFNGDLTFEMAFNKSGGVDRMILMGNGYFLTPPLPMDVQKIIDKCQKISNAIDPNSKEDKETGKRAAISAHTKIDFDFRNSVFHSNLEVFVNMGSVIKGIGPNGRAGEAVMHFGPNDWYIHIGRPDDRVGLKVFNLATFDSYFMTGTNIPSSPPPPARVSEILGGIDLDYMADLNALGTGKGMAFGAGMHFSTGKLKFPPFYARFDAGAGFDVMLKHYGDVKCKGKSGSLGINGWYANGQVWAYIEGSIGIKVNLFFIKKKVEILKVGAATVLQAKLLNPHWMRGTVGGRYSILGGKVSGSCRFRFTVGKECEIVSGGSPVQSLQVIADATPNEKAMDVSVFNAPQAVFNLPVGEIFELKDLDGNRSQFQIILDHFRVMDEGTQLQGDLVWNAEKDVVAFKPYEILPPNKQLRLDIQVSFKEKKETWYTITEKGTKVIETWSSTFTTGDAPDYIPVSNVKYSYPLPMMFNYYQDETDIGYIQLKQGQAYLFETSPEWKQIGRFVDKQGNNHNFNFKYIAAEKKINFIRPDNLQNNTIYSFELVKIPSQTNGAVDENITNNTVVSNVAEDNESTVEITTKEAEGSLTLKEESKIFKTHFRTSKYNRFTEKMDAFDMAFGEKTQIRIGVHLLLKGLYNGEKFGKYETTGNDERSPLIQFENLLTNKPWYQKSIYPYLYKNYPLGGKINIRERETLHIGIPPIRTNGINQSLTSTLTEEDVYYNYVDYSLNRASIYSNLVHYVGIDYRDLSRQVCANYFRKPNISPKYRYLIETPFPQVKAGVYEFNMYYVLPGINKITSTKKLYIKLK